MKIDLEQIKLMKHSIGFNESKVKGKKNRKYIAYRNYYATSEKYKPELDGLIELGFMNKRDDPFSDGYIFYVTDSGLQFLETLLEVKIKKG